jgi:hypothetical protein
MDIWCMNDKRWDQHSIDVPSAAEGDGVVGAEAGRAAQTYVQRRVCHEAGGASGRGEGLLEGVRVSAPVSAVGLA